MNYILKLNQPVIITHGSLQSKEPQDMALVDDVKIIVKAGNGGNGAKSFLNMTGSPKTHADGGDGGRGGDVYFQASNNVSDLSEFRFKKSITAKDGQNGMKKNLFGRSAEDTTVLVPPGTQLINEDTEEEIEIIELNIPVLIAKGGRGGQGNHDYHPDINRYQPQHDAGGQGEEKKLHVILNLIADVGLIGLPNAGKSSLLKTLTNAMPKIGDYPFTTLEPNLGAFGKIIIADIPGLIEGASKGKGLGITFLKHIEKTKILMHCIDATSENVAATYETVRKEFEQYGEKLLEKDEIILLTKTDLAKPEQLKKQIKSLEKFKRDIIPVSIYDESSMEEIKNLLVKLFRI